MNVPYGIPKNAVYGSFSMNPYSAQGPDANAEMRDNPTSNSQPSNLSAFGLVAVIGILVLIRVLYEVAE